MPTLNWIGKDKVVNHHLDIPYRVLEHQYDFNPTGNPVSDNKIIHADNLLALKSLLPEYEGRIKCIYIDPPYNTGNEGWEYNDNVNDPRIKKWLGQVVGKEAEDLTRHDKWLCMMYPRLRLLHKLLAEDAAIFISINEEEQAPLKLLLDEIFGKGNYLTMFSIKLRHEERILKGDKDFHEVTEQLFFYRKSNAFKPKKKNYDNTSLDEYIYEIEIIDDNPILFEMDRKIVKSFSPTQFRVSKKEPNSKCLKKINIRGTLKEGNSSGRFYMKHLDPLSKDNYGYLFSVPDMGDDGTGQRYFLLPKNEKKANGDYFQGVPLNRSDVKEVPYPNYFDFTNEFNRVGYQGGVDFRFGKKPIEFLTMLFEIAGLADKPDAIILDSFGGSGSTADAVLNFNLKYPGSRSFITIEMMHYAETITAQRVRNVIDGYAKTEGTGGNFSFYTLGERVLDEEQNLNPNLPLQKIHSYIWYSETHQPYTQQATPAGYLGKCNNTGIYFHYEPHQVTTLDDGYLMNVTEPCEQYIMYADNCLLSDRTLLKHNIVFKKIPRDISKL